MPAVAIGVAVIADVVAGSAAIAGTLTAFGAIAAVGATIGAVGAVTKTPALEYIGGALGAVGGLGALATSAGLLPADSLGIDSIFGNTAANTTSDITSAFANDGSAASDDDAINYLSNDANIQGVGAAGTAPTDAAAADTAPPVNAGGAASNVTTDEAQAGLLQVNQSPGATAGPNPLLNTTGQQNQDTFLPGTGQQNPANAALPQSQINNNLSQLGADNPSAGSGNATTGGTASSNTTPVVTGAPAQAGAAVTGQPAPTTQPLLGQTGTSITTSNGALVSSGKVDLTSGSGSSSGALGGLLDLFNKSPALALGATQALGNFISGATSTLTPAQVNALNAQAAANTAATALTNRQIAAMSSPKSVATLSPVTGSPAPLLTPAPQTPGLINVNTGSPLGAAA